VTRFICLTSWFVITQAAVIVAQQGGLEQNTPHTFKAAATVASPPATIQDFTWLSGEWTGPGLGGSTDESWSAPAGGAMMGMFRLVRDGKIVFYEFLTLVEHEGSVVLKLKHFNADLTGWEEKANFVTFRLLRADADAAYFSGLTFKRATPDSLEIFLALRDAKTGTVREERFAMTRKR
jgi:hypothetical protein